MKVRDLIERLSHCPQDAPVRFFLNWESRPEVKEISPEDADGFVVLGDDLPAEIFARDYKAD